MSQIEPGDREEMLLQGILNGDTTTNIDPVTRKEYLLKAILENGGGGGGGGGSLPEVTVDDDGATLRVVNGEWGKSNEGDVEFVNFEMISETEAAADKTNGEILDLIADHKTVAMTGTYGNFSVYGIITGILGAGGYYRFAVVSEYEKNLIFMWTDVSDEYSNAWNVEIVEYARPNGYYEEMAVGEAEQLISKTGVTDRDPYGFRTTGGSADVGNRKSIKKVIGGSVVFNQLLINGDFADSTGWTANRATLSVSNNEATLTMTSSSNWATYLQKQNSTDLFLKDHKYLVSAYLTPSADTAMRFWCCGNGSPDVRINAGERTYCSAILTKGTAAGGFIIYVNRTNELAEGDDVVIDNVQIFDLTMMFGVADDISADDFRRLFPSAFYEYNAGTMLSVETYGNKTVGFNLLEYGDPYCYAKVVGGEKMQITGNGTIIAFDDGRSNGTGTLTPDADGFFTPPADGVITVEGADEETCVHFVHSGYRNGETEPNIIHFYTLDGDLVLRGVVRLDEACRPYYDGDEYAPDGTVTRKYRQIVLDGTTANRKIPSDSQVILSNTGYYAYIPLDVYGKNTSSGGGLIADKFVTKSTYAGGYINIRTGGRNLVMGDPVGNLDTAEKWNTWLASNNVTVVYEVAAPASEQADPYQSGMICDDFGTEKFSDDRAVPMPAGHETVYRANNADKLDHLPDLANSDGDFVIHQEKMKMTLKPVSESEKNKPVIVTLDDFTADKTNGEILELLNAGVPVYIRFDYDQNIVVEMQVTCRFEGNGFIGLMAMGVNAADDILAVAYTTGGLDDDGWTIQGYTLSRTL